MYPSSTPGLPSPGGNANNWGSMLNDYLQRSLQGATTVGEISGVSGTNAGELITAAINPYTGTTNTNLATGSLPGLVQLSGDFGGTYSAPLVAALQGNNLSSSAPGDGNVLTWSAGSSEWLPVAPSGTGWGLNGDVDGGGSNTVFGGTSPIDGGVS